MLTAPDRKTYLGGGDIAAVAGLSPWRTAVDVYCSKVGLVDECAPSEPMLWGIALEGPVADEYARRSGVTLAPGVWTQHHTHAWAAGTPDRIVVNNARERWGLEVKTSRSSHGFGADGSTEIPDHYRAQVAWYQMVTGLDRWDLAVLIAGSDYRVYRLGRDLDLEAALLDVGRDFWHNNVLAKVAPGLDASDGAQAIVRARWPKHGTEYAAATDADAALMAELHRIKETLDRDTKREREIKHLLQDRIGEARGLTAPGWRATWSTVKGRSSTEWEAVARGLATALGDSGAAALDRETKAHTTAGQPYRRFTTQWDEKE